MTENKNIKAIALERYCNEFYDLDEYNECIKIDDNTYCIDGDEYIVYTEKQAFDACANSIKNSLWFINAEFIEDYIGYDDYDNTIDIIRSIQNSKGEYCNEFLLSIIESKKDGLDGFVDYFIKVDCSGSILSPIDGEEIELENNLYAYRI